MNEKPDMMINIYGGNNLIAPVASSAIQNFYMPIRLFFIAVLCFM